MIFFITRSRFYFSPLTCFVFSSLTTLIPCPCIFVMSVPVASISICVGRSRHLPVLCRCEPSGLETVPKTGPLCVPLFGDTVRSRIVCGDSLPFAYYICPCIAAPVSESYSTLPASSSELPRGCNGYRFGAERAGRGAGCCRINRRSGPNSGGASGEI